MTEECKVVELSDKCTLTQSTLYHDAHKSDLSPQQMPEFTKKFSNMNENEIIENLYLLNYQLDQHNEFIEYLSNLTHLTLSNCELTDLPNALNILKNLMHINLNNNKLHSLPNCVCELNNLKELSVCDNQMKQIPNKLGNLSNLEVLNLNINQLTELPNSCAKLNQLKICDLRGNKFKRIPNCIAKGMKNLQILEFSHNPCSELNVYPKSTELTMFCAEKNNICPSFPKWILSSKFKKLGTVSLNETRFQTFNLPKRLPISYIKRLSMRQCHIQMKVVENIIVGMTNLEELIIGSNGASYKNYFKDMPIHTKKRPSSLKEIDVCDTGLLIIPKIINKFINLSNMDLSCNNIYALPEEVCFLKNLSKLIMDKNHLANLPENIGELTSLRWLKMRHNNLNKLPESMKSLKNLEYIDLYDNELETIPEVIMNLSGLIGLDLEQNYFSTEYLRHLGAPNYIAMRENLRNVWPDVLLDCESSYGYKPKPFLDCKQNLSSSSSSSSCLSEEKQCMRTLSPEVYNKLLDERWDTSEDSADEFDPRECRQPKKRLYPPFTFYKPFQRVYCPAESHEVRVRTRIAQMLKNGSLVWPSSYEEGQFDDP